MVEKIFETVNLRLDADKT